MSASNLDQILCLPGQKRVLDPSTGSCQSCLPGSPFSESLGMYCPGGAAPKARLCQKGHYCPNPSEEILVESGYYARAGWSQALECRSVIGDCEGEGNTNNEYHGVVNLSIILGTVFAGLLWRGVFYYMRQKQLLMSRKKIEGNQQAGQLVDDFLLAFGVILKGDKMQGFVNKYTPLQVHFHNLTMHLKPPSKKCIVDNVTGTFPPGCTAAVMGPSGGGKTSFMSALAGRANGYADVTGGISLSKGSLNNSNNDSGDSSARVEDGIAKYPSEVGFVPQDDIMHEDLTVYQNLYYSAQLRLPSDMPMSQKDKVVEDVLEVLEIGHIRDVLVGGAGSARGISGGQKKRVNIGLELVAYPRILFLDEPTSGLDSTASLHVARCLVRLRSLGISTICVIHQPRYSVFSCFSDLLLLAPGGKTVYLDDTLGIHEYLVRSGYRLPAGENVADWMLDVVAGNEHRYNAKGENLSLLSQTQDSPQNEIQMLVDQWKNVERLNRYGDLSPRGLTYEEAKKIMDQYYGGTGSDVLITRADSKQQVIANNSNNSSTGAGHISQTDPLKLMSQIIRSVCFPNTTTTSQAQEQQVSDKQLVLDSSLFQKLLTHLHLNSLDSNQTTSLMFSLAGDADRAAQIMQNNNQQKSFNLNPNTIASRGKSIIMNQTNLTQTGTVNTSKVQNELTITVSDILSIAKTRVQISPRDQFKSHTGNSGVLPSASSNSDPNNNNNNTSDIIKARLPVPFFTQLRLLTHRSAMQFNVGTLLSFTIISFLAGSLTGRLTGTDVDYAAFPALANGPSTLFGIVSAACSLNIFLPEREVFRREMKQISVTAYFLSKQIISIPMLILLAQAYAVAFFLQTKQDFPLFGVTFCFVTLNWYIMGMAMWFSIWISKDRVTLVAMLAPSMLTAMFSGTGALTLADMESSQKLFSNISPGRWFSQMFTCFAFEVMPDNLLGLDYWIDSMKHYGYYDDMSTKDLITDTKWRCFRILIILGIVMRVLTLIALQMVRFERNLKMVLKGIVMYIPNMITEKVKSSLRESGKVVNDEDLVNMGEEVEEEKEKGD